MSIVKKYKKKPVIIEAVQFTEKDRDIVFNWITCNRYPGKAEGGQSTLVIETLEGKMVANINDYIIKGIHGEFYPCKSDIFSQTYEEVEE